MKLTVIAEIIINWPTERFLTFKVQLSVTFDYLKGDVIFFFIIYFYRIFIGYFFNSFWK